MTAARSKRTLRNGLSFMILTCLISMVGYRLAGWPWLDAAYMVTITIFGVGYGEVHALEEPWLKIFTMGVIFAGCSSLIYVIGGIAHLLTEGEIERMLGKRTRSREIDQLSDHTIICGYGRVGQMLAAELHAKGEPLVILDRDGDRVDEANADGFLAMMGDAVSDDVLQQVGLFRASTLATVLPDDATNVFITLTARDLSNSIRIIARAESPCTERKLIRGGASHVVMPAAIGAVRIAQLATSDHADRALPEARYRMLATQSRDELACEASDQGGASVSILPTDVVPQDEVEKLADLATDLSRTVAQRHIDHVIEVERQEHPDLKSQR